MQTLPPRFRYNPDPKALLTATQPRPLKAPTPKAGRMVFANMGSALIASPASMERKPPVMFSLIGSHSTLGPCHQYPFVEAWRSFEPGGWWATFCDCLAGLRERNERRPDNLFWEPEVVYQLDLLSSSNLVRDKSFIYTSWRWKRMVRCSLLKSMGLPFSSVRYVFKRLKVRKVTRKYTRFLGVWMIFIPGPSAGKKLLSDGRLLVSGEGQRCS